MTGANNTGYFKEGEAPEKTAVGILHLTEKGGGIWTDAVLPHIKKYCK